ncbi:hypothetical protein EVAR_75972_1 [Eumeta japonica]|uniref:Uncharacterized protein n=1 Tax=Eumeta variegata TaxID=151549 RepID=A0A4C1UAB7_EUMVA|nr:hypothetical protein EVAR_75972_1 [Eumeta japonica]
MIRWRVRTERTGCERGGRARPAEVAQDKAQALAVVPRDGYSYPGRRAYPCRGPIARAGSASPTAARGVSPHIPDAVVVQLSFFTWNNWLRNSKGADVDISAVNRGAGAVCDAPPVCGTIVRQCEISVTVSFTLDRLVGVTATCRDVRRVKDGYYITIKLWGVCGLIAVVCACAGEMMFRGSGGGSGRVLAPYAGAAACADHDADDGIRVLFLSVLCFNQRLQHTAGPQSFLNDIHPHSRRTPIKKCYYEFRGTRDRFVFRWSRIRLILNL